MSKLEKLVYYTKYTAGSYLDAFSSIPIYAAEKMAKGSERLFGEKNPRFLSWDYIKEKSPIYRGREKLRDSLDTRAGAVFLQSNVIGMIPFVVAGMPAAELARDAINSYIHQAPEIVQHITNSLLTLAAQMVAGYTTFMANEVRTNRNKYIDENGRLSIRKVGTGIKKAVKAFLTFDLSYIGSKTIGQSALLYYGKDPWKASAIFDSAVIPTWYSIAILLGLRKGVIETKQTKKWEERNRLEE